MPQVGWDFAVNKQLDASFDGSSSALKSDLLEMANDGWKSAVIFTTDIFFIITNY